MNRHAVALLVFTWAAALALNALLLVGTASAQDKIPGEALFRAIYQELIEINTTDSVGDTTKAAEAVAARLRAAGFSEADLFLGGAAPRKGNLVARLHGTGKRKPLLLLAHLDVVEAKREDWSADPFKLLEKDGYFFGRGSIDDKAMAAIFVDTLIRFKQEGFVPDRDLILALTTDEELGSSSKVNGVRWLLANRRDRIEADFALNEGGGGELRQGRHIVTRVQTAEKVPANFRLEVLNSGGHSSLPRKDNAIYQLAQGLARLSKYEFPFQLSDTTRTYLERSAPLREGQIAEDMRAAARPNPDPAALARLAADPFFNSTLRTTCVATKLEGGHAANALPQMAAANVNCRIFPGEPVEDVRLAIVKAVSDEGIKVTLVTVFFPSPPSALRPDIIDPIERINQELFPGARVIPSMSTGATDGRWLRNAGIPVYGVSGLYVAPEDYRAHGKDERIGVKDLFAGREFLYRLVKAYSSGN